MYKYTKNRFIWSNSLLWLHAVYLSAQGVAANATYTHYLKGVRAAQSFLHSLMQIYFKGYG